MFSARWIRENSAAFDAGLARRGVEPLADRVLELDEERRAAQAKFQAQQHTRNRMSKEIGAARGRGEDTGALLAEVAAMKESAQELERREKELAAELDEVSGRPPQPAGG